MKDEASSFLWSLDENGFAVFSPGSEIQSVLKEAKRLASNKDPQKGSREIYFDFKGVRIHVDPTSNTGELYKKYALVVAGKNEVKEIGPR